MDCHNGSQTPSWDVAFGEWFFVRQSPELTRVFCEAVQRSCHTVLIFDLIEEIMLMN